MSLTFKAWTENQNVTLISNQKYSRINQFDPSFRQDLAMKGNRSEMVPDTFQNRKVFLEYIIRTMHKFSVVAVFTTFD